MHREPLVDKESSGHCSCYNYDENPQWCEDHPSELIISDIKFFKLKGYASGQFPIFALGRTGVFI